MRLRPLVGLLALSATASATRPSGPRAGVIAGVALAASALAGAYNSWAMGTGAPHSVMVGNACASAAEVAHDGAALLQSTLTTLVPLADTTLDVVRAAGANAVEVLCKYATRAWSAAQVILPLSGATLVMARAAYDSAAALARQCATLAWSTAHDLLPLCGATLDVARAAWTSGADLVCKHMTRVWLWVLSFTFATANEPLSGASQGEVWTAGHGVLLYAMLVVVLGVIVLRMTRAADKHIDNVCAMERNIAALTRAVQDIVEGRGGAPADLPQDDAE